MTPFVSTHDQEKGPLEVLYPLTQDLENILGITKAQQKKKKGRNQQSSSSEEEEATGDD